VRKVIRTTVPFMAAAMIALADWSRPAGAQPVPTFTRDVAPIFYERCVVCHRPGQISPMSLLTYKDARPWSRSIRARVSARTMPPWFAAEGHRDLAGDSRLNDNELMTIVAWVDAGALEGDLSDLPPPPVYMQNNWLIGQPDAVFALPREISIPASGPIDIQYFEVPTGFTEDKWVSALEIRPGDPAHVHHVLIYHRDTPLGARAQPDDETAPIGTSLGIYASGAEPLVFPADAAQRLPAGSTLVFEVHYTTNGTPGRDQTRVGLRFARGAPAREVRTLAVNNVAFVIPPGEANHAVTVRASFDEAVSLVGLTPHAHRRGRSFEYRLVFGDGRAETILAVPRYNWLWETSYRFAEPISLPPGTALEITAIYDNSSANKANPDPRNEVRSGWDPSTQEMMFSYIVFMVPHTGARD
jgi:hypothetical protein